MTRALSSEPCGFEIGLPGCGPCEHPKGHGGTHVGSTRVGRQPRLPAEPPFDPLPPQLVRDYRAWRETTDGKAVFLEVLRRARAIQARGFKRFAIGAIWEAIRYDFSLRLGGDHGFRLNDHYCAFIAREVMDVDPNLEGLFQLRESVADREDDQQ